MSGLGMRMDFTQSQNLKQILAPRMIQSMEILQLSIIDLQTKIEEALQENPFLELKEKHGEQDEVPPEDFNPDAFHDRYREALLGAVQQKIEGKEIVAPTVPEEAPAVVDLPEALKRSLEEVKARSGGKKASGE